MRNHQDRENKHLLLQMDQPEDLIHAIVQATAHQIQSYHDSQRGGTWLLNERIHKSTFEQQLQLRAIAVYELMSKAERQQASMAMVMSCSIP